MSDFANDTKVISTRSQRVLRIRGKIGEGGFACCYSVYDAKTRRQLALKVVRNSARKAEDVREEKTTEVLQTYRREVAIHQRLRHQNIVRFVDAFRDTQSDQLCILLEKCGQGTVEDLVQTFNESREGSSSSSRFRPNVDLVGRIVRHVARGLAYIHHQMNVVHRDVKPANILITDNWKAKLTDFGVAGNLKECRQSRSQMIGTWSYMAPEVYLGWGHSARSDVWSLGVSLYYMLVGTLPFRPRQNRHDHSASNDGDAGPKASQREKLAEISQRVVAADYTLPTSIPDDARELLYALFTKSPELRLSAGDMLASDFCIDRCVHKLCKLRRRMRRR